MVEQEVSGNLFTEMQRCQNNDPRKTQQKEVKQETIMPLGKDPSSG